jgi:hypothetical protein
MNGYDEVKTVDDETGDVVKQLTSKETGPFGEPYGYNIFKIGYSSVKEYLRTLKSRNILGEEIEQEQAA